MADDDQQQPETVVSVEEEDDENVPLSSGDTTTALRDEFIRVTSTTPLEDLEPLAPANSDHEILMNNTFDSSILNTTNNDRDDTLDNSSSSSDAAAEEEETFQDELGNNNHTEFIGDEVDLEGLDEEVEVGSLRAFEEEPVHDFSDEPPKEEDSKKNSREVLEQQQKLYLVGASGCCCLAVVMTLIILSVVLTGHGKTKTTLTSNVDENAPPPIVVAPATLVLELPAYTLKAMTDNTLSPQALAHQWLARDPNLETYSEERKLQRFVMSTLYYSWRGDANWTVPIRPWNSYETHECYWYQAPAILSEREALKEDRWWTCWEEAEGEEEGSNGNLPSLGSANEKEEVVSPHIQLTPPKMDLPTNLFHDSDERGGVRRRKLQQKEIPTWGLRRLHLPNNGLVGRLPPELALLTNLESIDVSQNTLFGGLALESLEEESTTYPHMKALNVSYNLLTETTEASSSSTYLWHAMEELQTLDVSHNAISKLQPRPASTVAVSKLKDLNVAFNKDLTGSIGELLLHFLGPTNGDIGYALTSLQAHHNQISGTLRSLALLTNLEYLSFDDNQLTGPLGTELGLMTNLQELLLYDNALTSSIPSEVGSMAALKVLGLHTNQLVGPIPTELGLLSNLEAIWLYNNNLTGAVPTTELESLLGDDNSLEYLILYDNPQLTGTMPEALCEGLGESLQFDCVEGKLCGCDCLCEGGDA